MVAAKKSSAKAIKTVKAHTGAAPTYVVRSGDSLVRIAEKRGMKPADLKRINHLTSNALQPGQQLVVKG